MNIFQRMFKTREDEIEECKLKVLEHETDLNYWKNKLKILTGKK